MSVKFVSLFQNLLLFFAYLNELNVNAGRGDLIWKDDFDSLNIFNENWKANIGGHGWGNNELQYYTNSNHRLENGILIIEARKDSMGFTSSRLISRKSFTHGIFEMRAMLPSGRGTWSAFWLLGDKRPFTWPDVDAITVMNHFGHNPFQINASIHCKNYNSEKNTAYTQIKKDAESYKVNDYHNFTLDWSNNRIEVYLDGLKYFVFQKKDDSHDYWPFDNGFNIILNLAVGGRWAGAYDIDETRFPALYYIDYVRQYKHVDDPIPFIIGVQKVALQAKVNNKFVCAESKGSLPLIANKNRVREWEQFEMTKYSDGFVVFKSLANQKYVCADNNGYRPLIANRAINIDDWEKFELVSNDDGTVSFRAKNNWKFVCADNYGNDPLIANKPSAEDCEKFYLTYY